MMYDEYIFTTSEIAELEGLLADMPEDMVIERMGLEARLEQAKALIADVTPPAPPKRAYLTFRGKPVLGSHGVVSDFGGRAVAAISDLIALVAAGSRLQESGPIPDGAQNRPFITGVAKGSFGFELELPEFESQMQHNRITENQVERALEKVQELLITASSQEFANKLSDLADEMHPRAIRKVAELLDIIANNGAWFTLRFGEVECRFDSEAQVKETARRLRHDVHEREESIQAYDIYVLPEVRLFELTRVDDDAIIRGKIGRQIADASELVQYLDKPVVASVTSIRVGQGKPRYTLTSVSPRISAGQDG